MEEEAKILQSATDLVATDPLSEVSRGERKALLGTTLVAIATAKGGLVPAQIPALGIVLSPGQRLSLLYLLSGILTFYLLEFWVYGRADLKRRRAVLAMATAESREIVQKAVARFEAQKPASGDLVAESRRIGELSIVADATKLVTDVNRFARVRILYDVYLPVALGLTALVLVLHETRNYPGGRVITWSLLIAAAIIGIVVGWLKRKQVVHWFAVKRHRFANQRFMRLTKKIQSLPEESPKRKRLANKVQPYLERTLKGPWV